MPLPTVVLKTRIKIIDTRKLLRVLVQQKKLPFTMQTQQQTQWCWAGVSVSVSKFFSAASGGWSQCKLVNAELGQKTCCTSGGSSACNQPWYLDRALTRTGNLASWQAGTVTYAAVQGQVNVSRPLGCRIAWSGGGGHFVVLYGFSTVASTQSVNVGDPWYGDSTYTYASFKTSYQGSGSWSHTYFVKP